MDDIKEESIENKSVESEPIVNTVENEVHSKSNTESSENSDKSAPDPFAYVKNNGFTSEIYKIEVRGLPKFYGIGQFRKLLNDKLKLNSNKVKMPGLKSSWLYVCFRSEKDREHAIEVLSGYKWKSSVLTAKVTRNYQGWRYSSNSDTQSLNEIAEPTPDPLMKRRLEETSEGGVAKKQKITSVEEQRDAILNSTAPLWNLPYEEQLCIKTKEAKALLKKLGIELVKSNPSIKQWLNHQKKENEGLPCKLLDTRFVKDGYNYYRNKCEFTIGIDDITGKKRVGFRFGSYASGSVGVGPADGLPTVPNVMKEAVKAFEKFVQNSEIEAFNPEDLSGHWRQLTVRYGVGTGQMMLIIGFHPQQMKSDELLSLKNSIREYYESDDNLKNSVTSVYFCIMKRKEKGNPDVDYELILGNKYIEEVLCGLKFKISPKSFFQINTAGAEILMESVKELTNVNKDSVLIDVCCGTGTIGLCLSKNCSRVLGIEIVEEAVEAARENAQNNGITNSEFFCGKADEIFSSVVSRIPESQPIVAVLDPPRAGLHAKAITMLRRAENLQRLVFMSCDSKAALKNFVELGRAKSKTLSGSPFLPVSAVVVDMFPHTNHFELILYFERVNVLEYNKPQK